MANESPLSLPMFDVKQPDTSKMNLGGMNDDPRIRDALENVMVQQKNYADALEKRYAEPNWFKVAAGFAKPQLGGFTASLGSAAQALGENVEQQRMVAPTVAQMRMQNSIWEAGLRQREASEKLLSDWDKQHPNEPPPPQLIAKVERLSGSTAPQATAAKSYQTATGAAQDISNTAQRFKTENPFYTTLPGTLPEDWGKNAEKTRKSLTDTLVASGMYTPEGLKGVSDQDLLDKNQELQKANASMKIKNAQGAGEVIKGNSDALQDLVVARDIASSPKLEKMLGLGAGQDAVSALFGWVAAPTEPGKIGKLNEAASKLAQADSQAYADFQVLQKTLQKNLADARSTIQNPSVGAQNLLSGTQPSVLNSRLAIVKMLDLIAHEKSSQIREGVLRQNYRGQNPAGFETDTASGYGNLQKNIMQERRQIEQSPTMGAGLPKFYNPFEALYSPASAPAMSADTLAANPQAPAAAPATQKYPKAGKPASPSAGTAPEGRITNLDRIKEAMRAKGMKVD